MVLLSFLCLLICLAFQISSPALRVALHRVRSLPGDHQVLRLGRVFQHHHDVQARKILSPSLESIKFHIGLVQMQNVAIYKYEWSCFYYITSRSIFSKFKIRLRVYNLSHWQARLGDIFSLRTNRKVGGEAESRDAQLRGKNIHKHFFQHVSRIIHILFCFEWYHSLFRIYNAII